MWFDRGLVWSYAFHHEEAIRCFERAVEHDAGFALARWGIAYAIGPNYNKQWEAFDPVDLASSLEKACDEVAAGVCAHRAAPVERALVEALGSRYQANDPSADLVAWNADYVEAMREVYRGHPDDLDVAALFADALMNLTPWALHGAKMQTTGGTYPVVVWALTEDDDGNRHVVGLSVGGKGDKALVPPDQGTFESYSQTG